MVVVTQADTASPAAAGLLRELLLSRPAYRERWQAHVQRTGRSELHLSALTQVLADHLRRTGELTGGQATPPRLLREAVGRTLGGRLTQQQLEQFIDAFGITRADREELWALFTQDVRRSARRVGVGRRQDPVEASAYRSVSLEDVHAIGADGEPHTHRTVHVVRAVQTLDRYTHRFDDSAVAVEVVRGGRPGPVYPTGDPGWWAVDIHLHDRLPAGQTAVLEHRTVLRHGSPPAPLFRRAVTGTVGSVTVEVRFHPARVPESLWWGRWERAGDPPRLLVPWQIGEDLAVHWAGEQVHDQLVGFTWQW